MGQIASCCLGSKRRQNNHFSMDAVERRAEKIRDDGLMTTCGPPGPGKSYASSCQPKSIWRAVLTARSRPAKRSTKCRLISMPADMPAEVTIEPSSTQRRWSMTVTAGNIDAMSAISSQCVVAVRPSSKPACASKNEPVQIEAVSPAPAEVRRIQSVTAGILSSAVTTPPGIRRRSIRGWPPKT